MTKKSDPVKLGSIFLGVIKIFSLFLIAIALSASSRSFAAEEASNVPAWLRAHVGEKEGRITLVVLQRARELYFQKVREGLVRNPCYFAMDATRPNDLGHGDLGADFTLSASPTGRFVRFRRGTAAVAI
jgi:hypothetical protein